MIIELMRYGEQKERMSKRRAKEKQVRGQWMRSGGVAEEKRKKVHRWLSEGEWKE